MATKSGAVAPAEAASNESTSFRKAPADINRMPGSAASMTVQERTMSSSAAASSSSSSAPIKSEPSRPTPSSLRSRKQAIQAMQPFLDSSTTADSPIQPTDIQLLTTSILSNQERQRVILFYQEKLIDTQPSLNELKQSLLFLSSSSWGQILEERKLAGKCSYPPCSNVSPSEELGKAGRGRYRINLRNKSVKAVEDLDLGEAGNTFDDLRDYFCGKGCYARSEWILRWVLEDKEIGLLESNDGSSKGGKGGGVLGGKWQKLTSHPKGYEQVELLEDIERENGVDFGTANGADDLLDGVQDAETQEMERGKGDEHGNGMKASGNKDVCNVIGNLNVIERPKANPTPNTALVSEVPSTSSTPTAKVVSFNDAATRIKAPFPSRTAYDVDVPNTIGSRFNQASNASSSAKPSSSSLSATTAASAEGDDFEADLDAQEMELSRILRFASLAPASKPRPRNKTIRFDNSSSVPSVASAGKLSEGDLFKGTEEGKGDDDDDDEPVLDAKEAKERSELRRMMDLAMDVRRDQRELGLLD